MGFVYRSADKQATFISEFIHCQVLSKIILSHYPITPQDDSYKDIYVSKHETNYSLTVV